MVENLPYETVRHKALTIEGYSRAAVQSYWRVPELKIGFELGGSPWAFMGTQYFLVTHAHLDHLAALPRVCSATPHDEDGASDNLSAGRGRRPGLGDAQSMAETGSRSHELRIGRREER